MLVALGRRSGIQPSIQGFVPGPRPRDSTALGYAMARNTEAS